MSDNNPKRASIAVRLRAAREQAGLSQGQAAKLLIMHRPTISEIEAGRRRVSSDELYKFSELYDVSIAWLMNTNTAEPDPRVELAARELSKLRKDDFDHVLNLLRSLRKRDE